MIENANDKPQSLLKAESDLEKAKHRLEEEKKKTNEKKRKADNHNKIVWGEIVKKYFPKADCFEQAEMEKILKAAIDFITFSEDDERNHLVSAYIDAYKNR